MDCSSINTTLSLSFVEGVKTLENQELKKRRETITTVTLLSLETGLCQLDTPTTPRAGWRRIAKEDLVKLDDENVLKRIGTTMATGPALVTCRMLVPEKFACVVESYWKTGIRSQPLVALNVVDVVSSKTHPELSDTPAAIFLIDGTPKSGIDVSTCIREFLGGALAVADCLESREKIQAVPLTEIPTLSDKDFVLKIFWYNFAEDFTLKPHQQAVQDRVQDLRKNEADKPVVTALLDEHRHHIKIRCHTPHFLPTAKKTLLALPGGNLIYAMIDDIANEESAIVNKLVLLAILGK